MISVDRAGILAAWESKLERPSHQREAVSTLMRQVWRITDDALIGVAPLESAETHVEIKAHRGCLNSAPDRPLSVAEDMGRGSRPSMICMISCRLPLHMMQSNRKMIIYLTEIIGVLIVGPISAFTCAEIFFSYGAVG